jgi:ParB-like chromosome segregation protein Spo0J
VEDVESAVGRAAAEWLPLVALRPWVHNPRKNDHRIPEAVASIRRFGFGAPIIAWKSAGRIVAGHARLKAMLAILKEEPTFAFPDAPGPGLVPVRFVEFANEAEANAYALRDNNPLGEWDETLPHVLAEIECAGAELAGLGWTEHELDDLLKKAEGELELPPAPDESEKAKTGFAVLIECDDEEHQREVIKLVQMRGWKCRALT